MCIRHVRAPPLIARVCIYSLDVDKTPLKARKRAAGSSGSAMPSKWFALATLNVDVFHYNPDVRLAPSTLLSSMSAQISHQPSLNAQWQKPHCEDSTLSSDRAARWTSSAAGGDLISVSAIRSHPPRAAICVCVCIWKWGRTVPKDCREHMCWWRPERVLKWRLMNEGPEWAHVCVDETEGSVERPSLGEQTWASVYAMCSCACG